jgi:hypothetical protein
MRHLVRQAASARTDVLARVRTASATLDIAARDKNVLAVLNGYEVYRAPQKTADVMGAGYVMRDLIAHLDKVNTGDLTGWYDKVSGCEGFLSKIMVYPNLKLLPAMPECSDKVAYDPETGMDLQALSKNLHVLSKKIAGMKNTLYDSHTLVLALTKKDMTIFQEKSKAEDKTMWGSQIMNKRLASMKVAADEAVETEKIETLSEVTCRSLEKLSAKIAKGLMDNTDEQKLASIITIPTITGAFTDLKNMAVKMVVASAGLAYVDEAFKDYTTYPAKFFLDASALEDLKHNYQGLISFLVSVPVIESKVIEPLDFMRLQMMENK